MQVVRFAPLVPLALVTFLFGCSANMPVAQQEQAQPVPRYQSAINANAQSAARRADAAVLQDELVIEDELSQFADNKSYQLPATADSIWAWQVADRHPLQVRRHVDFFGVRLQRLHRLSVSRRGRHEPATFHA